MSGTKNRNITNRNIMKKKKEKTFGWGYSAEIQRDFLCKSLRSFDTFRFNIEARVFHPREKSSSAYSFRFRREKKGNSCLGTACPFRVSRVSSKFRHLSVELLAREQRNLRLGKLKIRRATSPFWEIWIFRKLGGYRFPRFSIFRAKRKF